MGGSRRITWLVFIVGVVAVVDVLGWVTWQVLRLEREQADARAEAARQEAMGRALWRMDSIVLPLLAIEGARPYFDYQAFYAANRPLDQMWGPAREDDVLVASPLLGEPGDYVMLHFERDAGGRLTSPQAPQSPSGRAAAIAAGVPAPLMAMADIRLYELERMQGGSGAQYSSRHDGAEATGGALEEVDRARPSMRAGHLLDESPGTGRVFAPSEDRIDAGSTALAESPSVGVERSAQTASPDRGEGAAGRESRDAGLASNTVFNSPADAGTSTRGGGGPEQGGPTPSAPGRSVAPGAAQSQPQQSPEAQGGSAQGSALRRADLSGATGAPPAGAPASPPPSTSGAEARPEYVQDYEFRQQAAENAQLYNATGRASRARAVDQRGAALPASTPEQVGENAPATASAVTPSAVGSDAPNPVSVEVGPAPDARARLAPSEPSGPASVREVPALAGSVPPGGAPPDGEQGTRAIVDAGGRGGTPATPEGGDDEAGSVRNLLERLLSSGPQRQPEVSVLHVGPSELALDGLSGSVDDAVGSLASGRPGVGPWPDGGAGRVMEWGDARMRERTLGDSPMQPGPLRPVWIGGGSSGEPALLLVREVRVGDEAREQGVWIDWAALRRALESSVSDLFPLAEVRPLAGASGGAGVSVQRLATIPAVLIPGPASAAVLPGGATGWSAMRWTLLVGWVAVGVSVVAIGVVLRKAIELGERRGRFVSAVTHELRTPLTTFRLYSQMLAGGQIGDEAKRQRYAQTLDRESQRLSAIVESVLEYARLGRRSALGGGAGGAWTRMEAGALLERVMATLAGRAERGGMTLVAPAEAPACRVDVDPDKVERVLLNLVDNACKYAGDADDRRIVLEALVTGQGREARLALRVRDFGPGVPESERGRVFRAFHRARHHDASASPGLGLGLAIARGLAREMGGDLRLVESRGTGAVFELLLPVV